MHTRRLLIALFLMGLVAGGAGWASAAPPAGATLRQPSGVVGGSSFVFTWEAAAGATFYYLLINDATASPRFSAWYPAAMACPGGSATCSIALTAGWAAGSAVWWIQSWNPDGYGPWSPGLIFTVNYVPGAWSQIVAAAQRFQLVLGGVAVLDRETGLVWQRIPSGSLVAWTAALLACRSYLPVRLGWRLPTVEELQTLMDPTRVQPSLPDGHPFGNVSIGPSYWTSSVDESDAGNAYAVNFEEPFPPGRFLKSATIHYWCVRGGQGFVGP